MKEVKAFYRNTSLFFTILAIIMLFGFDMVEGSSSDLSIGKASFLKMGPTPPLRRLKKEFLQKASRLFYFLKISELSKRLMENAGMISIFLLRHQKGKVFFPKKDILEIMGKISCRMVYSNVIISL